ncbi:MAG: hypothetical protein ACRDBG_04985 [Waterburya sp.]
MLSKRIDKVVKDGNASRGIGLLLEAMGDNDGQKAQKLLNNFVKFAEGTLPHPNYDECDLRHDFTKVTGIERTFRR